MCARATFKQRKNKSMIWVKNASRKRPYGSVVIIFFSVNRKIPAEPSQKCGEIKLAKKKKEKKKEKENPPFNF